MIPMTEQPYMWPRTLFNNDVPRDFWTCARTRPRWEKRFARWLQSRNIPHFLPVLEKTTISHRKRRTTEIPIIPGYVFVAGNHSKKDFQHSACVVRLIRPTCEAETLILDAQLIDIWRSLKSGMLIVPSYGFVSGERVEVMEGPLRGMAGQFVRNGGHGTLIISIDLLGSSAAVQLTADSRVESLECSQRITC